MPNKIVDYVTHFWSRVDKTDGCWLWQGATSHGYGVMWNGERVIRAHRFAYVSMVGAVPDGLVLDHLCRDRRCVRPDHLEPVTLKENLRRGVGADVTRQRHQSQTHCKYGHEFTPENTYVRPGTIHRVCLICRRRRWREWKAGQK